MTFFITTFTLLSNIFFVVFVLAMIFDSKLRKIVYRIVLKYPLHLLFNISFLALIFSLAYSNIMNFPPCELCWIQRIFMYPQVLLSFIAMIKKDLKIIYYLLPMTIIGGVVSFYHSLVHWGFGSGLLGCTSVGGECAKVYVFEYNYITIPFMALSSFIYLLTVTIIYHKASKLGE